MEEASVGKRRSLEHSYIAPELPEAKRLRHDFLNVLDDEDDREDGASPDLVSVMKSLEDEIALSRPAPPPPEFIEIASDSGDSQPGLGYLLEASDDELGLPPPSSDVGGKSGTSKSSGVIDVCESVRFDELWGLYDDGDIQSYDAGGSVGNEAAGEEDVMFGGLFDFSDGLHETVSEFSDSSWRGPESSSPL